jgi:raffinose/stachyose/melibiose transport system substrate-binding protein
MQVVLLRNPVLTPLAAFTGIRSGGSYWLRIAVAFLLILTFASTACAQELVIESWRKDDQIFWDKVIIPAFQRKHPSVRLKFSPEEALAYDSKLDARLATRHAGDLIFCRPFDASVQIHTKGYLTPLNETQLKNFTPSARRAWSSDDGKTTYCLPVAYVIHGLIYNKQIFRQMKVEPPETLSEFMEVLKKIAQTQSSIPLALGTADMWESTQVIFTGLGPNFWGGEKARQGLISGTHKFTDPDFIRVWQMMRGLKPYMHPKQSEMSNADIQLLFATGQAAIYPTGSWDIDFLRNTSFAYRKNIEMGVFKPPVENKGQRCHLSVHPDFGIGINKNTKHPEAAQLFLDWLGTADFAQLLTDTLSGFYSLSNHPVTVNDPLGQDMLNWRKECDDTIRLNAERLNRVWPPLEDELRYVNVKVINQEMTPQQAGQHIQLIHEKNAYLR